MATSTAAVATNGAVCAAVLSVHRRPRARSARVSTGRRQETPATSGSAASSASGDRAPQDHELGVGRQLADLARLPLPLADDGVVALVQLLAERGRGGGERGGGGGRPLRQRRVPGAVHADQSCHALDATPPPAAQMRNSSALNGGLIA